MDAASIALFVLVLPHMVGALFLAWWVLPASAKHELRGWFREDDGGTRPSGPPDPSGDSGGRSRVPLPDASPSAVRMREPGRMLDVLPDPSRRPAHPARPGDPERRRETAPR